MKGYVLTVERVVPATPEVVFDVLADVSRHHLIDGSGMLRGANEAAPQRLALGMTFGMGMKLLVSYSTVNKVVEFEENRRLAWKTGPEGFMGKVVAGRTWRYELTPVEGGTLVRESWDITADHQRVLLKLGDIWSGKTRRDMERTLERLSALVAADGVVGTQERT
ncbi:MAG TPA: SRPBCC family protein [Acidimicrobiales bacterium]|nr:SRPBCC family protein [Acidimicrobiales bacterium]